MTPWAAGRVWGTVLKPVARATIQGVLGISLAAVLIIFLLPVALSAAAAR